MKKTYETGLWGENTALEYLTRELGMSLMEHRYRTKCGEIDLIMLDGETIVFVEVKTRKTGEAGIGLSSVNIKKQKRITNAAILYLMKQKWMNRTVRFDLVEIYGNKILHVPDAFRPYGSFR